jgi:hypothetical protein
MRVLVIVLALILACSAIKDAENFGDPGASCDDVSAHCGHVWMCPQGSSNPLGHIETCMPDDQPVWDAEEIYGRPCIATPRHAGTCLWGCGSDAWLHKCNAYDGCFGCKRSER